MNKLLLIYSLILFLPSCQILRENLNIDISEKKDDLNKIYLYCYQKIYGESGKDKNVPMALPLCQKAANAGVANAQVLLGEIYLYGDGVKRDLLKAYGWFSQAALQDHYHAQFMLFVMWDDFKFKGISKTAAIDWLNKSSASGYGRAINKLVDLNEK